MARARERALRARFGDVTGQDSEPGLGLGIVGNGGNARAQGLDVAGGHLQPHRARLRALPEDFALSAALSAATSRPSRGAASRVSM